MKLFLSVLTSSTTTLFRCEANQSVSTNGVVALVSAYAQDRLMRTSDVVIKRNINMIKSNGCLDICILTEFYKSGFK